MKRFSLALLAAAAVFAFTPAALAGTILCPNQAGQGGDGTGTFTNVTGPLDGTSCGSSGTAITMTIPNSQDYARLAWVPGDTGYPANLTLGNIEGATASVALTSGTDQPYYMLVFSDLGDSFLGTTTGDQIPMLEFQPTTLSGPGNDILALDPATTQFNVYDNTKGVYLDGGQADTNSLSGWIALDPGLSSDDIQQIRLAIGLSGGSGPAESLTVNSLEVTETAATPEPSSLFLLGIGLLGLAFVVFRKAKSPGLVLHS
jgi:hypothetical protein